MSDIIEPNSVNDDADNRIREINSNIVKYLELHANLSKLLKEAYMDLSLAKMTKGHDKISPDQYDNRMSARLLVDSTSFENNESNNLTSGFEIVNNGSALLVWSTATNFFKKQQR
ncbi:hypothetical protein AYI70_g7525 [Smittium culicis]|uniref:Uncharacterized protein n=1 Tax=Smittium culicis TaxID=133412 RepID=A0A1R1XK79_9FUNG|nr:hypothetical protein AYI70_g7525 [Smittium culicis]